MRSSARERSDRAGAGCGRGDVVGTFFKNWSIKVAFVEHLKTIFWAIKQSKFTARNYRKL